ncbi:MAG: M64 family metallopeptidase [Bdellovibrionales bacterium]|nr:M64 family metallopeptidase [Bdellovibrionales bacterium]
MKSRFSLGLAISLGFASLAQANPYWNPKAVPADPIQVLGSLRAPRINQKQLLRNATPALRITVSWEKDESYKIAESVIEPSGTPGMVAHSRKIPKWGSYVAVLRNASRGQAFAYDSIGTGREFRRLVRAMTFRFPVPAPGTVFELYAENPDTGKMESVLKTTLSKQNVKVQDEFLPVEVRELKKAETPHSVRVVFYAEGYLEKERELFFNHAGKTLKSLADLPFPGFEMMEFHAVFSPSAEPLGEPRDRGYPVPIKNSFLGLDYPYWNQFGRWYHVVYQTDEKYFRKAVAAVPYDFPIALVNESSYWGVGNYMSHTAIPARASQFSYLLHHEFGHFFGLNEEYEGGGKTELEFAEGIEEPWSQNITFLRAPVMEKLKWKEFVLTPVPLPTPRGQWIPQPPKYGAYRGGYADSKVKNGFSHKPGIGCLMSSGKTFCEICKRGILDVVKSWLP